MPELEVDNTSTAVCFGRSPSGISALKAISMEVEVLLRSFIPSWGSAGILLSYLGFLALAGAILPGKRVSGAVLPDGTRLQYKCNGFASLFVLMALLWTGISLKLLSPVTIADKGAELLSTTFIFSVIVTFLLYITGCRSRDRSSSLKAHVSGNFFHDWIMMDSFGGVVCLYLSLRKAPKLEVFSSLVCENFLIVVQFRVALLAYIIEALSFWWFGVQLNPHLLGIDLKFFFVRAGLLGWLFINLSLLLKSLQEDKANLSVILYQLFSMLYVVDYFFYEEFMTSTWDIIAERLGFMLVFGDLVFIPFTFTIQGWWLSSNDVELSKVVAITDCLVFLIGYQIFRGANRQKHVFKKDPKALIWGKPPKVIGGKLLASGYWGISRHCNYLGDILLALSFSLPCGTRSIIPYFYPIYLFVLLIWRERRDDARCSEKYKEIWEEYCKLVPWRIFPYIY